MARQRWGCDLYLIHAGELCKIGRSKHCHKRFQEISRSMPFAECRLVAVFPGGGLLEGWVFKALARFERRGEWFRCSPGEALNAVASATPL